MSFKATHNALNLSVAFGFSNIDPSAVKDRSVEVMNKFDNVMSVSRDYGVAPGFHA